MNLIIGPMSELIRHSGKIGILRDSKRSKEAESVPVNEIVVAQPLSAKIESVVMASGVSSGNTANGIRFSNASLTVE